MEQYFDYVGDFLKGKGPDKFTYYEVIVDDFTLPINTHNANLESEDITITINKCDLLAFGSDSIEINPCGEKGLCNIGLHKPYNKDWNYKIFQVSISKEFFESNTKIVNNITKQYKREEIINQIIN